MREADRVELQAAGVTAENFKDALKHTTETQVVLDDGVPLAMYGYVIYGKTIRFNFFATDECRRYWKTITRSARSYMRYHIEKNPHHRAILEVWEGHDAARRWLQRLGFVELKAYRYTAHGRMIYMEYRRRNLLSS